MMKKTGKGPDAAPRSVSKFRSIVSGITFLVAVVTLSLLATSGTYALWNGAATVNGSTISTGSIGVTVNGAASYSIVGLDATKLAPGRSVVTTVTIANTGTTPISATLSSVAIGSNMNNLATYLTLIASPIAITGACAIGLAGGTSAPLSTFTTASYPYLMGVGSSQVVCLELKLSSAAPQSVQGGATTFTINIAADQRRP